MGHDAQVMANEHEGQAHLALDRFQQVQNVGLNRHVQRRDAFVGNDELRPRDQRTGDGNPLPLTTGKCMRETPQMFEVQPAFLGDLTHAGIGFLAGSW